MRTLRKDANTAPMLEPSDEAELLRRTSDVGDQEAIAELLGAHLRLVLSVASRYQRPGISLPELVAEGNLGLVEAARRFDPAKDVRFSTYAVWWVRARIGRFVLGNRRIVSAPSSRNARKLLSSMSRTVRELERQSGRPATRAEIAAATGTSEEDVAMVELALRARDVTVEPADDATELCSCASSPEDALAENQERARAAELVADALAALDCREREIVRRRFLEDCSDTQTLATIGRDLGLSRERVRQIELRAKQKLRCALRSLAA